MSDVSAVKNPKVRILSLNGGGARGMFTISVLAEIERILTAQNPNQEIRIGEYFDLITGTSIGGILALGLASGKSARELEKVFFESAHEIFPKRWAWVNLIKSAFAPIYSSVPLRKTIESMIGAQTTFNDLKRRVMIPAVNLTTGKPQIFKTPHNTEFTRDGPLKIIDAALATSAAPTFFAPHHCKDLGAYFADGGLVANNPSYIALLEIFKDFKSDSCFEHKDIHILNIGTVGEEYSLSPKQLSRQRWNGYLHLWGFGKRLVLTTMTANQHLHKNMLLRELAFNNALDNYISIDETIPNEAAGEITLDNASRSSLENLQARGKQLAHSEFGHNQKLRRLFIVTAESFDRVTPQEKS
ncbi:TPA: cGAMP-activated phospholipase CapV [Serratia marcescens]|nr:cGAMP-activated phospholipase CapV [Serratia marcescens]HAT4512914.1 cGAMP-activated phospholipase CapV [Serratia marcescens]HAT4536467.1 cGAMP-activated phospholipase CapV [Serratia marcescens]